MSVPSLLRDLVRDFSVSFFELNESDGLFCNVLFVSCALFGGVIGLVASRISLSLFSVRPFASNGLADDGGDDNAFVLLIHAAAIPLDDVVPMPDITGFARICIWLVCSINLELPKLARFLK